MSCTHSVLSFNNIQKLMNIYRWILEHQTCRQLSINQIIHKVIEILGGFKIGI